MPSPPAPRSSNALLLFAGLALGALACSSSPASTSSGGGGAGHGGGGQGGAGGAESHLRGARYCEVLVGTIANADVHVKVFASEGLNDCPEELWSKLDVKTLEAQTGAPIVLLNGPRYWTLDSLAGSTLIDKTVVTFGGIEFRQAGAIDFPLAEAMAQAKPYVLHTIQRHTVATWRAGRAVFELVAPDAHVFTMQSYSVQDVAQTEASLASLGGVLKLPAGWSFRTRTLDADLVRVATNGTATVVQDDRVDTYYETQ